MKKIYILLIAICVLLICSCGGGSTTDTDSSGSQAAVTVTYFASQGGYIEGEDTQTKDTQNNEAVTFSQVKAVAESGYYFVKWSDGEKSDTRYDTLSQNTEIEAIFEPYIRLNYSATEGGFAIGKTNQYLKPSQEGETVEAVANSGYRFIGWNDGKMEAVRSDIVTQNASFIAMFDKIEYSQITYEATQGGIVEGIPAQTVEKGQMSQSVKATPTQKGYYFVMWDDGVLTAERSDLSDTDKTVTAIFTNKYTVTYNATEGGHIAGSTVQELEYGSTFESVMAVADKGYVFVRWDDGSQVILRQDSATVNITYTAIFKVPYTVTFNCDSERGTIVGSTSQTVPDGEKSQTVKAVANEGYTFVCWSNGSYEPEIQVTAYDNTDLYAHFSHASTGLPVVSIVTETGKDVTSKTEYIGCTITLLDTEKGEHFADEIAKIRGRGNSTWNRFDKKPYKIKFETKQDFFDNGKAKTWVLLADYRDYSLIRNMLAYEVGEEMSELKATPDCQSVEVYLNGKYHGVYLLCEQIEVNDHRVEASEDITTSEPSFLVEMDGWTDDVQVYVPDQLNSGRRYSVKFPDSEDITDTQKKYIEDYLKACMNAIQGDDYTLVTDLIDVKSFAQAYIIYDLFKNPDTNYSSLYFYKDINGKLICGPIWDFDMSVGNVSHKGNGVFESTETLWSKEQCPWFKALLSHEEFVKLVGEELTEYAPIIRATIKKEIEYALAHSEAYKKNFEKWNILGKQTWSNPSYLVKITTWEEHIEYVENYLEESLQYLEYVYCSNEN